MFFIELNDLFLKAGENYDFVNILLFILTFLCQWICVQKFLYEMQTWTRVNHT